MYCFDPRESTFFTDQQAYQSYRYETLKGVELLRQDLVSRGSNLLITNGQYEKVVPSIARVLHAHEVVTFGHHEMQTGVIQQLMSFNSESLSQVSFQLNMHSIGFRILNFSELRSFHSNSLPPFPKINPGRIPSAA
jgi:deoxyribodipyrimidine photolyase